MSYRISNVEHRRGGKGFCSREVVLMLSGCNTAHIVGVGEVHHRRHLSARQPETLDSVKMQ